MEIWNLSVPAGFPLSLTVFGRAYAATALATVSIA